MELTNTTDSDVGWDRVVGEFEAFSLETDTETVCFYFPSKEYKPIDHYLDQSDQAKPM